MSRPNPYDVLNNRPADPSFSHSPRHRLFFPQADLNHVFGYDPGAHHHDAHPDQAHRHDHLAHTKHPFDPKPGPSVVGRDFIEKTIQGIKAGHIDPKQLDFTGVVVPPGTDLSHLEMGTLGGAALSTGTFAGCNFTNASFKNVSMRNFCAPGANFAGARFENVEMPEANLAGAHFNRTGFSNVNAGGADFTGAKGSVEMKNVNLSGAFISGATLSGHAHNIKGEALHAHKANIAGLNFSGKNRFQGADFDEATMSPKQYATLKDPAHGVKSMMAVNIAEPSHAGAHLAGAMMASAPSPFATV